MNATYRTLIMSLLLIGCGLDSQTKNHCAVQADCLDGFVCTATGTCELDPGMTTCTPATCAADQCGTFDDGCGGTMECGCTLPKVCAGDGVPNQCAVPTDQCIGESDATLCMAASLLECGTTTVVDHCGTSRNLDCGTCTSGVCGAMSYGLCDEIVCTASGWCRALGGSLADDLDVRDLWGNGSEVWAAASSSTSGRLLHFDGTRWITHANGTYPVRAGAGSGAALWLASEDGALLSVTGSTMVAAATTSRTWSSMHAISPTDIWVVGQWGSGSGAYAKARHFDGSVWSDVSYGGAFDSGWYLNSVHAASSTAVWAVGAAVGNGSITDLPAGPLIASYNGTSWTIDRTLPNQRYLRGVHAVAANNVWAVGDFGTIFHFDGSDWSLVASGVTQHLFAITGVGNTLWAAGTNGTILRKIGTGNWTVEQSGTTRTIFALWATSTSDVWAGGEDGLLLRYRL
jgi:hypothetical protein